MCNNAMLLWRKIGAQRFIAFVHDCVTPHTMSVLGRKKLGSDDLLEVYNTVHAVLRNAIVYCVLCMYRAEALVA